MQLEPCDPAKQLSQCFQAFLSSVCIVHRERHFLRNKIVLLLLWSRDSHHVWYFNLFQTVSFTFIIANIMVSLVLSLKMHLNSSQFKTIHHENTIPTAHRDISPVNRMYSNDKYECIHAQLRNNRLSAINWFSLRYAASHLFLPELQQSTLRGLFNRNQSVNKTKAKCLCCEYLSLFLFRTADHVLLSSYMNPNLLDDMKTDKGA